MYTRSTVTVIATVCGLMLGGPGMALGQSIMMRPPAGASRTTQPAALWQAETGG